MLRHLPLALLIGLAAAPLHAAGHPAEKQHTNSIGMKFIRIEPGEFVMGQGDAPPASREEWRLRDHDESPARRVRIAQPFHIGIHEVTNAQYEQFDPSHKNLRGKGGVSRTDDEPVTFVTWHEAVAFCDWLSKKEGKAYRLPTEAEWEYVCRSGTTTLFATGDEIKSDQANFGLMIEPIREATTQSVGKFPANGWGVFDLHGNVEEWCHDWYGLYEKEVQSDPVGRDDGIARVTRGGSFMCRKLTETGQHPARFIRSANRGGHLPEDRARDLGFRVVLGELPKTKPLAVAQPPLNQRDVKAEPPPRQFINAPLPVYRNFTQEKKTATIPKETWGPIFSQWNHYAAVTVCPNRDVLAVWYTTVSESGRELSLGATRLRAGSDAWEPASLFFDVPDMNDHAPVLLTHGQRIHHFCLQAKRGWDHASIIHRTSDDSGATWSKPRIILSRDEDHRLSQPCSAFVAKDGTIVLAVDGDNHRDERIMTSSDDGKTWRIGKGDMRKTVGAYAIHPAIVPRSDGSILAFLRGPNPMAALVSKDQGDTWEPLPVPFPGISVGQKAAALRLHSGAILLVSIDNPKQLVGGGTFAALSYDDGKTWSHVRKVEGVTGYMSAAQANEGMIYVFGTRMNAVAFNEAWIKSK